MDENRSRWVVFAAALVATAIVFTVAKIGPRHQAIRENGSDACRQCHQQFYQLWSSSYHGLSLRQYTSATASQVFTAQDRPIFVGQVSYLAVTDPNDRHAGHVVEDGPKGRQVYRIRYLVGGKDVCYLLTELDNGRLQVLPVAYDVRRRQWYPTTESMVRHAPGLEDAALDWQDPALTFNSSCYHCHVSQAQVNYDPRTDTFSTMWSDGGVSCQTCHGPGSRHIEVCSEARGQVDLHITTLSQSRGYTALQVNSSCAPCHAKAIPLTGRPCVGDDIFDHYDLVTLEDPDFWPDGRDLGENFTYTQWLISPCARSGRLDCLHCHTPSGRYRFPSQEQAHQACMPCHKDKLEHPDRHTHHDWPGGPTCTSCHMPTTEFARIRRSDHSMRPPMPAATIAFGSPNACNICHADRDANWADAQVRSWHERDYQARTLFVAGLIADARKGRWHRLQQMLDYIQDPDRDEVFANSVVRLLVNCPYPQKVHVLLKRLLVDPSPLIRSSIARVLASDLSETVISGLAKATADPVRLVRIRAAEGLSGVPMADIPAGSRSAVKRAIDECILCLAGQPHRYDAQYNLANIFMDRGENTQALQHFLYAIQLRPDFVPALVNAALCLDQLGRSTEAQSMLQRAISADPNNIPAHLNLGLLLGQLGQLDQAALQFQIVLDLDPDNAVALYNLASIRQQDDPDGALQLYGKAVMLRPQEGRYVCACADCLLQVGQVEKAIEVLEAFFDSEVAYAPAYLMLGRLYMAQGRSELAKKVYSAAAADRGLGQDQRALFRQLLADLSK